MTYEQTLDFLFNKLPMFSRIGAAAIKKDLHNTRELCALLGNPQERFRSLHIAGTNGKGSTSHMLAAILQAAGYKTGLYTSPHLYDFRERIRLNGELIPKEFVTEFVERMQPDSARIDPSFFELTVAMAFEFFARQQVDIAVVEVGLGGQLDSTNIIRPELSVITQIGWDHMNLLGNSLEAIAGEKAGIIKAGIPVVVGEVRPETRPVFETKAAAMAAPLTIASEEFYVTDWTYEHTYLTVEVAEKEGDTREHYQLDLTGIYQLKNLLTVLQSVRVLRQQGWQLSPAQVRHGLKNVKKSTGLQGRWELLRHQPLTIMDVGHNEDGISQLVKQIEITDHQDLHLVLGMVKDKEIDKVLSLLPRQAHYYFTRAQIPRALPEDQLAAKARQLGLKGNIYPDVNLALAAALEQAGKRDLVLVCGSVFLVGDINRERFTG